MNRSIIFFLTLFSFSAAMADNNKCSDWVEQKGISCILGGNSAKVFTRNCENACWWNPVTEEGNMNPECDQTQVCHTVNPSLFLGSCSEWIAVSQTTCFSQSTQSWEQQWVRSCKKGLEESSCSKTPPL